MNKKTESIVPILIVLGVLASISILVAPLVMDDSFVISDKEDAGTEEEAAKSDKEEKVVAYDSTEEGINNDIPQDFCVEGESGKLKKGKNFAVNAWKSALKPNRWKRFKTMLKNKDTAKLFESSKTLQCKAAYADETEKAVRGGNLSEAYEWDGFTPEDARPGEVAMAYRLLAIQTGPAQNPNNKPILKKAGVHMRLFGKTWPLNAMYYFPTGIGDLKSFIAIAVKKFKIQSSDIDEQIRQIVAIISRCAIGKYQIMPAFHFKHLDGALQNWDTSLPEKWTDTDSRGKLRILHAFLRTESMQDYVNYKILKKLGDELEYYIPAMSTAYYAGSGAGKSMLKLREKIETGKDLPGWTTRTQRDGFGSIYFYSMKSYKGYQNITGKRTIDTTEDLQAFQISIAKKETGFLHKLRAKGGEVENVDPQISPNLIADNPVEQPVPATEPIPEKEEAPKPAPKKGDVVKKNGKICAKINGEEMCIDDPLGHGKI